MNGEPVLDGRGDPIYVDSPDGRRLMTAREAEAGDAWARSAAALAKLAEPGRVDDPADVAAQLAAVRARRGVERGDD